MEEQAENDRYTAINEAQKTEEDISNELMKLILESKDLAKYLNENMSNSALFINDFETRTYSCYNNAINLSESTDDLRRDKFLTYCFDSIFKGEYHYFPSYDQSVKCSKCGWTRDDINKKEITHDELTVLINHIIEKNKLNKSEKHKSDNKINEIDIETTNKNELISEFNTETIVNQIERLVDRISQHMNRTADSFFIEKYTNLFKSILMSKSINLVDTMVNTYFMKYWRQIANEKKHTRYMRYNHHDDQKDFRNKVRELIRTNDTIMNYFYQSDAKIVFQKIDFLRKEESAYVKLSSENINFNINFYGHLYFILNGMLELFDNDSIMQFNKIEPNLVPNVDNPTKTSKSEEIPFLLKDVDQYRRVIAEFIVKVMDIVNEKLLTYNTSGSKSILDTDDPDADAKVAQERSESEILSALRDKAIEHYTEKGQEEITEGDITKYQDQMLEQMQETHEANRDDMIGLSDDAGKHELEIEDQLDGGDYGDFNSFGADDN